MKDIGELFFHGKRHLPLHKSAYQSFRFLISSQKDGRILQFFIFFYPFPQFSCHSHIFFSRIVEPADPHRTAVRIRCGELLGKSGLILPDHFHSGREYFSAAPVIYIQHHLPGFWIIFRKIQHDLRPRSPEVINGLVIVSHNKQVVLRFCQKPYYIILELVDILKLIYKNIPEFTLPRTENILSLVKKLVTVQKHIVKIQLSS